MNKDENILLRLIYFVSFTIYGFVPTIHWAVINGLHSDEVKLFLPRIFIFYLAVGLAFTFYIAKFPESCLPGKFDIFFSSHQWWHAFIWAGLAYWHHTGFIFAEFRLETSCAATVDREVLDKYYDKFWITLQHEQKILLHYVPPTSQVLDPHLILSILITSIMKIFNKLCAILC